MLEKIVIHNMMALDRCQAMLDKQSKFNKWTKTVLGLTCLYMIANQLTINTQDRQIKDLTKEVKELKEMKGE